MKRILICLLLLTTLLSSLCACQSAEQAPASSLENPVLGFSFSYPAGWKTVQNDVMIQIVKDDSSSVTLCAFELLLEEGQELKDYLSDYSTRLSADLKDLKMENEKILQERWSSFEYTATHTEGKTFRFMQCFTQEKRRVAVLTLCAPAAEFAEYNKGFEASLSSFSFTEKKDQEAVEAEGTVTNDAVEYSLLCPKGWQLLRNDGMIAIRTEDGSTLNSGAFTVDATVQSLDGYMNDRYFVDFDATVGKHTLLGEYRALTVDGRYSGLRCEYTATVNGTLYHFDQLLVSRAGYIYSFLYTAKETNFALHREDVNKIMESIRFTKG